MQRLVTDLLLARADENTLGLHRQPADRDDLVLAEAARLRRRGRDSVDTGGVGLGLAIVAEVARAHGGTVHVEPVHVEPAAAGSGARFVVHLPAVDAFSPT